MQAHTYDDVPNEHRYTRENPCPVCGGYDSLPQHRGVRCWGFLSADGNFAHCTREEYGSRIPQTRAGTYAHRLGGTCLCGVAHLGPAGTPAPLAVAERQPVATTYYEYIDEHGVTVAVHKRIDYDDGSKAMPWCDTEGNYVRGLRLDTLPLFGLPHLLAADRDAPIFFCEGEKAAQAVQSRGLVGICCAGGAKQRDFGDAFAPLVGRTVFLLPDNDSDGAEYMPVAAAAQAAAGARPVIVPLPGVPPKGDAHEYLQAHSADDLLALCLRALDKADAGIKVIDPARYPGWRILHVSDYLAKEHPRPKWLVKDHLLLGGTSLMVAKAKVGKSTLARDLIFSVLRGEPWRVGDVTNLHEVPTVKGTVVYFPMEEHVGFLHHKVLSGIAHIERLPLYLFEPPDVEFDPRRDADYDPVENLERLIEELDAKLIVLDPIADWLVVKDYNSYAEVRAGMMRLTRVARRTGAHIMALHHANKAGQGTDGILGSAALSGAVDTMFLMRRVEQVTKEKPHEKLNDRYLWSVQRYGTELGEVRL